MNKETYAVLKYGAIAGLIIFLLWIIYNGIDEGFKATPREMLGYVAKLLAERGGGRFAEHGNVAFALLRHTALAQRHLLPQVASVRPTEGQHAGVPGARRKHEKLARSPHDTSDGSDVFDHLLGDEAAEDVGSALLHHYEVVAHLVDALLRAVLYAARERDQRQRAADREPDTENRQAGADGSPPQIAQREPHEVHAVPCNSRSGSGMAVLLSSTMTPSLMRTWRGQRAASFSSCVTRTRVMP